MDEEGAPGSAGQARDGHVGVTTWLAGNAVGPNRQPVREPVAGAASSPRPVAAQWAFGGDDDVNWGTAGRDSEPRYPYHQGGPAEAPEARGLGDDTPAEGTPTVGTPLWHEAARHTSGFGHLGPYQSYEPPAEAYRYPPGDAAGYQEAGYQEEPRRPAREDDEAAPAHQTDPAGYEPPTPASYEPPAPASYEPPPPPGYEPPVPATTASLPGSDWAEPAEPELPKRVPGEPELPHGVEDVDPGEAGGDEWTAPELARIADELRRTDVPRNPDDGFDMDEVLAAVRGVAGVRDAWLRANPTGVHTLRLDLADDADPAYVSKEVARMLGERMGLTPTPRPVPAGEGAEEEPEAHSAGAGPEPHVEEALRPAPEPPPRPAPEPPRQAPEPARREPQPRRQPEPTGGREPQAPPGRHGAGAGQPSVPAPRDASDPVPRRLVPVAAATGRGESRDQAPPAPASAEPARPEPATRAGSSVDTGPADEAPPEAAAVRPQSASPASGPRTTHRARHASELAASLEQSAEPTPEEVAEAMPRPLPPPHQPGVRVVIDHVQVNMFGLEATVEVRLAAGERRALGLASGPAVDGYVTRLAAVSAARAIDQLLRDVEPDGDAGRCFVEHTGVVPFGTTEVAVVVVQLVCEGWVEQLAGCAVVTGDPRQAVVRATLGAVNRRLEALLA